MKIERKFKRITFDKSLDVKRLKAALSQVTKEIVANPVSDSAPARIESVLIEPEQTTVHLSGNKAGLDAVAMAVKRKFAGAKTQSARAGDARRTPQSMRPKKRQARKKA